MQGLILSALSNLYISIYDYGGQKLNPYFAERITSCLGGLDEEKTKALLFDLIRSQITKVEALFEKES